MTSLSRAQAIATLGAAVAFAPGVLRAQTAPLRLGSSMSGDGYFLPFYGDQLGIFKQAGLAVEMTNLPNGGAIAAALADLEERVSRPLVLIVGMLANKDCAGFLGNFTGLARRVIAVPVPGAEKGMSAEAVADAARAIGLPATSRDNLDEALDAARKLDLDPSPRILITGSLYLAGDVLRENGTPPT